MQKQVGSIMMVAGTCIGSGMIALPMVLVKLGLIPSLIVMLIIWAVMYYTSLISLELNLQAKHGLSLGALGRLFSGRIAELIGTISIKLLSYALLAVFIYGGSSVLQNLLNENKGLSHIRLENIESWYAGIAALLLLLPIRWLDYVNRLLFLGLLGVAAVLVIGLASMITLNDLPLVATTYSDISVWYVILPVVFTAFGFQVIFHTLTNYCNRNAKVLKRAFLWGSFVPGVIYIVWTFSVLIVVHHESPLFYEQMILGKVSVGDLIEELSKIAKWQAIQSLVWWISSLAIVTSVIGVGVGLCDSLNAMLSVRIPNIVIRKILSSFITIFPAYIIAVLVPNAFIAVLGFAGMILVIIAILLPVYLLSKTKVRNYHYPELGIKSLIVLSVIAGIVIIGCEFANIITK